MGRKEFKRLEKPRQCDEDFPPLPGVEVPPPAPAPILPAPEVRPTEAPAGSTGEIPKGLSTIDMLTYLASDRERAANLERLIWSTTGLVAMGVGAVGAITIFALHYRVAGDISLASAAIAAIASLAARFRLRKKRNSGQGGPQGPGKVG